MQMKISIMLLLVVISTVGNAQFVPNVQCACEQIVVQQECTNWNCKWVNTGVIDATLTVGYCSQVQCAELNQTQCQNSKDRCYYQASESGDPTAQVCYNLSQCEDIILKEGTICQESNQKCVALQTQSSKCVSSGQFCIGLNQSQCSPTKGQTFTNEGLCYWNGSSCKLVSQCGEINSKNQCEQTIFQNACQWSGTACIPQTCQQLYTSTQQCTFIQSSPQIMSVHTPCNLNGTVCTSGNTQSLLANNCATSTNYFYRWIPTNGANGFCVQCNPFKYVFRNQCECQSLLQKNECLTAGNCQWTSTTTGSSTGTCSTNPCSAYTVQQQCAQVKGCYWNTTQSSCVSFTSCSNIQGQNAQICYSLSIYCPGSNGTTCQSQQQLNKCQSITLPNLCYNSIGIDGYCTYFNNACTSIKGCDELSFSLCKIYSNSCIWKIGANYSCTNKTCSDYSTQDSCTFIQNNINNNIINICTWNPNTQKCSNFDNSFSYDVNSCYNSTGRTHHWSEPSNAQNGFCLPCYYSSVLNIKSNCECSDLTNYTDCALSSPKCYWNANTSYCQNQICYQLTSQPTCILSKYCYWNSKTNTCQGTASSTITCSTLSANTQQECLSQSIVCAGITSNGQCQSSPNSCSDFKTFYQCFGSVGTDGICQWNPTSLACQGISKCSMINTQAQCELVLNTCYWDLESNGTNVCMPYNCASLYSQKKTCNYYLSTPNQNYQVQYCIQSGQTCSETTNLSSLTSSNCYSSTGGTARWDSEKGNGTCVLCNSQLISVLFIILSQVL